MVDYDKLAVYSKSRKESLTVAVEQARLISAATGVTVDPITRRLKNRLGEALIAMGTKLKENPPVSFELAQQ